MYKYGIIETENRTGKAAKNQILTWLFEENGTLSIFGSGMLPDYRDDQTRPWQDYAAQVRHVVIDDGITTVGARTFAGYELLESVKLPASMTRIGFRAFAGCTALKTVTAANPMAHVRVTDIAGASHGALKAGTTYFSNQSFARTPWIRETYGDFYIHQNVLVEYYGVGGTVTIPEGVREIGVSAFENTAVTAVVLPESLRSVGAFAFNKTALFAVEFPRNVKKVAKYAFAQTENMTSVLVGNPKMVIESLAFWNSAVEDEIILSKKDKAELAKAERLQKKDLNDPKLTDKQRETLPAQIEAAAKALENRTVWTAARETDAVPGDYEWGSVYTLESVRETAMEPCKRLEARRDTSKLIGLTDLKAGEQVMKKLSTGGNVIRITLDEDQKTVVAVQTFVKDGKDTYASYRMIPGMAGGVVILQEPVVTTLTKKDMQQMDGNGLRSGDKGCVWYQAPRTMSEAGAGISSDVINSRELKLLRAWMSRHPEYRVKA